MADEKKKHKVFKVKKKTSPALKKIKKNMAKKLTPGVEIAVKATEVRRDAEVSERAEELKKKTELLQLDSTDYVDEDGKPISKKQMDLYREIVSSFYGNFVVLSEEQIKDLKYKLPSKVNGHHVTVGPKAIFPPMLDTERKKVARGRVVEKAHRLRYIEDEAVRGLKMPDDIEEILDGTSNLREEEVRRAKKDLVRTLISLNYNDYEMCEYLKLNVKDLTRLKKEVYFEELTIHRQMNNEELFIQYKLQQMEVIKDLDVMVERFKGSKQLTALASALKAKSEIYNEIINKGYEFGVIEKTPDKSAMLIGNLDLTSASIDDLKAEIRKTTLEMQSTLSDGDNFLKSDDV